ncbi:MAG: arginase [Gammaproteobacteria bacterium]|nr:arginase [Gammaproteobacteria bacterium]MCD8542798.1 arginase [Gammaproteobacteria bacterium]
MKKIHFIGAALGIGGYHHGSSDGPFAFQHSTTLQNPEYYDWANIIDERSYLLGRANKTLSQTERLDMIVNVNTQIAACVFEQITLKHRFCTIGGDHSCAIGTWSGAASAIDGDLGLIWVDAHMDAHTFDTSHTKNIHGMPVAALLGYGDKKLTHLLTEKTKLKPENLCLIGVRSFEYEEAELLKNAGVTVYTNTDIQQEGLEVLLERAHKQVTRSTSHFGFSIDLDGFDPEFAPGTGTPVACGINAPEFCRIISRWAGDSQLIGYEIAEYNPHLDKDSITEKTMTCIINAFQKEVLS